MRTTLISEDLELGTEDERGHVAFAFPRLGYLSIISDFIYLKMSQFPITLQQNSFSLEQ